MYESGKAVTTDRNVREVGYSVPQQLTRNPMAIDVVANLEKQIERLHAVLDAVSGRLVTVCRAEPPSPETVSGDVAQEALPPLLDSVASATRRISKARDALESILVRLEV